jgi:hypothetical protein
MKLHDIAPQPTPLERLAMAEARIADLSAKLEVFAISLGEQQQYIATLVRQNEDLTRKMLFLTDRNYKYVRQRSDN